MNQDVSVNPRAVVGVFAAIIAFKVWLLFAIGPVFTPDSYGYDQFADFLAANSAWITQERLHWDLNLVEVRPKTLFRVMGYPLLVMAAKALSADHWAYLLVVLQAVVSLGASIYVYRLSRALGIGASTALFVAFVHGTGQAMLFDLCILTDSLNASLLVILGCHVGVAVLAERKPHLGEVAALGGLVFLAFLLREGNSYLQILYWPLIAYWALRVMDTKARAVVMFLAFVVPMVLGVEGYKTWNQVRTGERFVTIGGNTAFYVPLAYLQRDGIDVFGQDALLADMPPLPPGPGVVTPIRNTVHTHLARVHGLNELEIVAHGRKMFFAAWREHTADMAALTLSHMREKQALLAVMTVNAADTAVTWATGQSPFPKPGALKANVLEGGRYDQLLMVAGRTVERVLSLAVSAAFLLGVPLAVIFALRRDGLGLFCANPKAALMGYFWLLYFGYVGFYALISLEMRYLLPVTPFVIVSGMALWGAACAKLCPWLSRLVFKRFR